jgi:hypothetical protein
MEALSWHQAMHYMEQCHRDFALYSQSVLGVSDTTCLHVSWAFTHNLYSVRHMFISIGFKYELPFSTGKYGQLELVSSVHILIATSCSQGCPLKAAFQKVYIPPIYGHRHLFRRSKITMLQQAPTLCFRDVG